MKEVTKGANAPLMLLGIDDLVNRHVDNVSTQGGLAVPLYNLNRFYNGPVGDTSIKRIVQTAFGEGGHGAGAKNIIEQVMTDLQKNRGGDRTWVDSLVSNYVSAVLTFNPSVTIKQMASYEAAGIYLSQRALGKLLPEALGRVGRFADTVRHFDKICKEIDKYTGLHYMRRIGLSTPEISMMKKTGWRNKLPGMKWIQYVDCVTTAALWEATKKQVGINYAAMDKRGETHAEVGSEEYWNDVTALYERVIVDTQPMYDVLHRPEFSKKDNKLFKVMNMFKTVPFQNLGILADSVSEFGAATKEAYNAYKNKQSESQKQESKEKFKKATHKLQRVARVTITGIVAFELFTIFSNLVKRKDKKYRDEYGDLTWGSFKEGAIWELASNLAATLFPYSPVNPVDTVKSFTENGPSWDFVSGLPAGEVINDALNGINNVRKAIDEVPEILDDETVDTWGLINKLFGKDSAVFGLAKTLGQATGVPVGNYADIGASIYGVANDIYNWANNGKNPFEGEYTKSQIINKLYDMRMDGDTAGAGKAYEEAIHIKNKNGEELGKKGVESEMVKRLADDPTLAELADAYMDYDFTTYDLLFSELSEKGFTDNEISKARDKYRKELLEEETEDDPDEDPEQYKEFPYKDVAQAIKDGKSEYIDRALEYYRAEGVTDDALKSGITRWMKPIYADADENDRKKYQDILNNRFGFNKDKYGKKKEFDFSKWETSYTYNDLYSAVTGGAGDQAHEIFESLAMLKGPGEEGRKKAREELAGKLREVYVKMNSTERADMHDFLKKYCGFPSNYNFGAWLNRNYK